MSYPGSDQSTPTAGARKRSVGMVVVSVLATIVLVVAAIASVLYVNQRSEATKLTTQVSQLSAQTADGQSRIATLERELADTKRDLSDAKAETTEIANQKKVVTECLTALYARFDTKAGTADEKAKLKIANEKCKAADKYL